MTARLHRRAALGGFAFAGISGLIAPAFATDTTQYWYDSQGRVIRVQFQDGSTVVYSYDAAGNRTQVARTSSPPSNTFTATIAITGPGPINLYTLATAAGYDGTRDANVTFTLDSSVTIIGSPNFDSPDSGHGIDVGDWPITQFYLVLALQISGTVYGGGGRGGEGNGASAGSGGDAIYCRAPMSIIINDSGVIKSGGGGGAGGAPSSNERFGGGGGGGGAPNGLGGPGGEGTSRFGHDGSNGTTSGGGSGGAGGGAGATAGWVGGDFAMPGDSVAGYAIRKNGFAVSVTNNGTISGTVG